MGYVNKHFSLSQKACEVIRERDRKQFPLERDFVDEAVLTYGERISQDKILREIRKVKEELRHLNRTVGWE